MSIDILSTNISELESSKRVFSKEGFYVRTYSSINEKIIEKIYSKPSDVILLDLDLNDYDGIELCYQLKREKFMNSLVILFTNHSEDYIQVEAFKAGADDYIIRPINPRLLLKKIFALLRRKEKRVDASNERTIFFNNLKIDRDRYLVLYEENKINLPRKDFEILCLLVGNPNKVFSREEIFTKVWRADKYSNTRIIDVHIRKIREKVGENIIKTIKGVGYQLA